MKYCVYELLCVCTIWSIIAVIVYELLRVLLLSVYMN